MKTIRKIPIGKYIWVLLFFLAAFELFTIADPKSYGSDIPKSVMRWGDVLATALLSISLLLPKEKRFLAFDIAGCAAKTALLIYETGLILNAGRSVWDTTTFYFLALFYAIPILLIALLPFYKWEIIKKKWGCTIAKMGIGLYLINAVLMVPELWDEQGSAFITGQKLAINLFLKPLFLSAVYSPIVGCLQPAPKKNKKDEKNAEQTSEGEKENETTEKPLAQEAKKYETTPQGMTESDAEKMRLDNAINYQKKKQRAEGKPFVYKPKCPKCNANLKEGAKFCPQCGEKMFTFTCSKCGAKLNPGDKVCSECGEKLSEEDLKFSEEAKKEMEAQEELEALSSIFVASMLGRTCPVCGCADLEYSSQSFDAGKAALGAAVFGTAGLLAGHVGKNKRIAVCKNCGHRFTLNT